MNKWLIYLCFLFPVSAFGAGGHVPLDQANTDLSNQESLQRGARFFVNYCLTCHSAHFMRYNRMGRDLGLTDDQVADNLMFASEKPGEVMSVSMDPEDAKRWFGTAVPDLSVVSRSRGVDWLYTYLRSFYVDESRPFGYNNLVFKDVGMPHVLEDLQGVQELVTETTVGEDGTEHTTSHLELVEPGLMTPREYDRAVRDLVAFLEYMGEPAKLERKSLGAKVLLFLLVFFVIAYLLKKEYWKDVH